MKKEKQIIRHYLTFFIGALFLSGLTAIPLSIELNFIIQLLPPNSKLHHFIRIVLNGITKTHERYPFLFYGYDWLAFAHFVLALLFIGPYQEPVRNKWVIEFGMVACLLIIPFALCAGYFREIPFYWRLIDCSFGIIGIVQLAIIYKKIKTLEAVLEKQKSVTPFIIKKMAHEN